jgi:hypothetical protein
MHGNRVKEFGVQMDAQFSQGELLAAAAGTPAAGTSAMSSPLLPSNILWLSQRTITVVPEQLLALRNCAPVVAKCTVWNWLISANGPALTRFHT